MPDQEPTLREVLARIDGLGARLDAKIDGLDAKIDGLGARLDARIDGLDARIDGLDASMGELREEMETLGRETRRELHGLPAQVADGVLAGFERSAYVQDLRNLKADVAELKRASGE